MSELNNEQQYINQEQNTTNDPALSPTSTSKDGKINDEDLAKVREDINNINTDTNFKIPEHFPTPRPTTPDKIYTISQDTDVIDVPEIDKINESLENTIKENQNDEKEQEKHNKEYGDSSQPDNKLSGETNDIQVRPDDVENEQNAEPQVGNELSTESKAGNTGDENKEGDANLEYDEDEEVEEDPKQKSNDDSSAQDVTDDQEIQNSKEHDRTGESDNTIDDSHHNNRLVGVAQGSTIPQANRTSQMNQIYDDQQKDKKEQEGSTNGSNQGNSKNDDKDKDKDELNAITKDAITKFNVASEQVARGDDDVNYSSEGALNTKDVSQEYYENFLEKQEEIENGAINDEDEDIDEHDGNGDKDAAPMKSVGALIDGEEPETPPHKRGSKGEEQHGEDKNENEKANSSLGSKDDNSQNSQNKNKDGDESNDDKEEKLDVDITKLNGSDERIEIDVKQTNPEENKENDISNSDANTDAIGRDDENDKETTNNNSSTNDSPNRDTSLINKLPIYVTYTDSKYLLFPLNSPSTKEHKALISKSDKIDESSSLDDLFAVLRLKLKFEIKEEIKLSIPQFNNIVITEDNVYCKDLSISDFFDVYDKLCDCTDSNFKDKIPEYLEFKLSTQPRFITNYNDLVEQSHGFDHLEPPTKKRKV
ncbi:uncharacterized protein KGF55_000533 [Candida pseudojiufengensis]|uniref:uncharacterized protein n=1 Tax=Candida pseudojiufengensis TaxID=497109 RepID=UPI0022248D6A|nr:uncharacterized protein KGF55_000533 [Candida pseudojiufengensis]KAI5966224.1 hypothetical protein KGF55_000533 [Candida pseudojiufengensis]